MKRPKEKNNRDFILGLPLLFIAGLVSLLYFYGPDIQARKKIQKENQQIAYVVDWSDIKRPTPESFAELKDIPVSFIVAPPELTNEAEDQLRESGFSIIWKSDEWTDRIQPHDGLMSGGEKVVGYPRQFKLIEQKLVFLKGFLPLVEFAPQVGRTALAKKVFPFVLKAHCLQAKESIYDKRHLWKPRLIRAVRERGVQLLYIQFGSALTFDEWLTFLRDVKEYLEADNFSFQPPAYFTSWNYPAKTERRTRLVLASFISLFAPILLYFWLREKSNISPFFNFLFSTGLVLLAGCAIYALGSFPQSVVGLEKVRGTKSFLVGPLLASFGILLSKKEWLTLVDVQLRVSHLLWMSVFCVFFLGVYLMRSGNFPLLPVSDFERIGRDMLEGFLGVRPRFKEFLIGHPLLILGLYLRSQWKGKSSFFQDGRFCMALGSVGLISIINTFLHFHTPIEMGLLRTFHGIWLGLLFSIPLCVFTSKFLMRRHFS